MSGPVKASEIPFKRGSTAGPILEERKFTAVSEGRYRLEVIPAGVLFDVDRLRRSSHELHGELSVLLTNGHFPRAHTIGQGVLSSVDLNFSSAQARVTRAKLLRERAGDHDDATALDWIGCIEELSVKIIHAERDGGDAVPLADVPIQSTKGGDDSWEMPGGLTVLKRHPTVFFGKGAAGKSYVAMWVAGFIAQHDVNVLYLDWELTDDEHRRRLERLFSPMPRNLHYLNCRLPLRESMDRISRQIAKLGIGYAVCDSVAPAARAGGGRFQDTDLGQEYFGLIRQLGIGTLHVAHPPKHVEDDKDATIFGSAFFGYLARSIWFFQATEHNPAGEIQVGLYHHKLTTGQKRAPLAYRLAFDDARTRIEPTNLRANDELASKLPVVERMVQLLTRGPMTDKALAEALDVPKPTIRKTVRRHASKFVELDNKTVALATEERF